MFKYIDCIDSSSHNTVHQRLVVHASIPHVASSPVLHVSSSKAIQSNVAPVKVVDYSTLNDEQILSMVKSKALPAHNLEKHLPHLRAVHIRRILLNEQLIANKNKLSALDSLPYEYYDYSLVTNQCCENVIGYIQIPVGYAGPLLVDDHPYFIPMATTEGISCSAICISAIKSEVIHQVSVLEN